MSEAELKEQIENLRATVAKLAMLVVDDMLERAGRLRKLSWEERAQILDELVDESR